MIAIRSMTEPDHTRRDAVLEQIVAIIRGAVPNATGPISATTTAKDVSGWDSIAHVQIILRVERQFKIRIRSTEIARLNNVGSLVELVIARNAV
jgi:acyl carrier protein